MDRGERRRRDEVYVRGIIKLRAKMTPWYIPRYFKGERLLSLRKMKLFMHNHCSKKQHGRPKVGIGCKACTEMSPKVARYQWRTRCSRWDLDACDR